MAGDEDGAATGGRELRPLRPQGRDVERRKPLARGRAGVQALEEIDVGLPGDLEGGAVPLAQLRRRIGIMPAISSASVRRRSSRIVASGATPGQPVSKPRATRARSSGPHPSGGWAMRKRTPAPRASDSTRSTMCAGVDGGVSKERPARDAARAEPGRDALEDDQGPAGDLPAPVADDDHARPEADRALGAPPGAGLHDVASGRGLDEGVPRRGLRVQAPVRLPQERRPHPARLPRPGGAVNWPKG